MHASALPEVTLLVLLYNMIYPPHKHRLRLKNQQVPSTIAVTVVAPMGQWRVLCIMSAFHHIDCDRNPDRQGYSLPDLMDLKALHESC